MHTEKVWGCTCVIGGRQKNCAKDDLSRREDDEKSGDHAVLPRQRKHAFGNPSTQAQSCKLDDHGLPNNQEYLRDERRPNEENERDNRCLLTSGELSVF